MVQCLSFYVAKLQLLVFDRVYTKQHGFAVLIILTVFRIPIALNLSGSYMYDEVMNSRPDLV